MRFCPSRYLAIKFCVTTEFLQSGSMASQQYPAMLQSYTKFPSFFATPFSIGSTEVAQPVEAVAQVEPGS